jgi:hypothetical protein
MIYSFRRFFSQLQNRKARRALFFPRLELISLEQRINPAIITVSNLNASGAGSLDAAITQANTTAGDDIINFSVTGTITLGSSSLPTIVSASTPITGGGTAGTLTINGPGASSLTISGNNGNFCIFKVDSGGNLTISGVIVSGAQTSSSGGAFNNSGTLTVTDSTISGNSANNSGSGGGSGGGIYNRTGSTLTISNSTISGNSAYSGGGIFNRARSPSAIPPSQAIRQTIPLPVMAAVFGILAAL